MLIDYFYQMWSVNLSKWHILFSFVENSHCVSHDIILLSLLTIIEKCSNIKNIYSCDVRTVLNDFLKLATKYVCLLKGPASQEPRESVFNYVLDRKTTPAPLARLYHSAPLLRILASDWSPTENPGLWLVESVAGRGLPVAGDDGIAARPVRLASNTLPAPQFPDLARDFFYLQMSKVFQCDYS